jgi:hypothetical protein
VARSHDSVLYLTYGNHAILRNDYALPLIYNSGIAHAYVAYVRILPSRILVVRLDEAVKVKQAIGLTPSLF